MKESIIEIIFWGMYIIFPLMIKLMLFLMEYCISTIEHEKKSSKTKSLTFCPSITILVSVGNCEKTLRPCIDSILEQKYPLNKMQILLIDNNSKDRSKDIFYELQMEYPKLRIWWIDNLKGKGNSISKGIYMAEGKYIINIDCNGIMGENLIKNFVYRFESDPKVSALAATVVSDPYEISNNNSVFFKIFQKCRLWKQGEIYFVEKKIKSRINFLFNLSKHCSAFRKDIILRACFNNGQTTNKNSYIGLSVIDYLEGRISLEEECLFYKKPIKSLNYLYEKKKSDKKIEMKNFQLFDKSEKKTNEYIMYFSLLRRYGMILAEVFCFSSIIYLGIIKDSIFIMMEMILLVYMLNLLICSIGYIITRRTLTKIQRFKLYLKDDIWIIFFMPICTFIENIISICGFLDLHMEQRY